MDSQAAKDEERRGPRAKPRPDAERIEALRARMAAKGQTVKSLAIEIGEDTANVYKVLSGTRAASSGAGHRIAVKLGLKDAPATTGAGLTGSLEPAR